MPTGTESSRDIAQSAHPNLKSHQQKQDSGTAATRLYPSPDSSSIISVGNKGTSLAKHKVLLGIVDLLLSKDPGYLLFLHAEAHVQITQSPDFKDLWMVAYC
jgi:hypothetical protein